MPEFKAKDRWDKMDIAGKLVSGVVLAVIAVVIKSGTDRIAAAQHRGDLVRALLADLTTKNEPTRQDIALIALNHSVGDENPQLVIEISELLVLDTTVYLATDRASDQALGRVAWKILEKRDPPRWVAVQNKVLSRVTAVRRELRSGVATDKTARQHRPAEAANRLLARLASNVIFLQYVGLKPEIMERLRKRFNQSGFVAPGVEHITTPFPSSVRYFHPEDSLLADSATKITETFLREQSGKAESLTLQNMSGRFRAPRGQIEVWLSIK